MGRARTGAAWWEKDHWVIRITTGVGKKTKRIHMAPGVSESVARAKAKELSEKARTGTLTQNVQPTETVHLWFERWFAAREKKGLTSTAKDRGRFMKWTKRIGKVQMGSVTKEMLEDLVEEFDLAAQRYAEVEMDGGVPDQATMMSWKSALNVWGIITKGFKDAAGAKARGMRCIKVNPALGVHPPDRGVSKVRSFISPRRFIAFSERRDVPIVWRRIVALAIYTYTRASELRGVRWRDVRADEGYMVVHRTLSADGKAGSTKTNVGRNMPLEPRLVPLLQAMRGESDALAFQLPDDRHMARGLRRWLESSGLAEDDTTRSATKAAITWHDLRGTGITWRAIRGDNPIHIMASAGHTRFDTTQKYIRAGALLGIKPEEAFPELPEALLKVPATGPDDAALSGAEAESPRNEKSGRWDLNLPPKHVSSRKSLGIDRRADSVLEQKLPNRAVVDPIRSHAEDERRADEDSVVTLIAEVWDLAVGNTKLAKARRPGAAKARLRRAAELLERERERGAA